MIDMVAILSLLAALLMVVVLAAFLIPALVGLVWAIPFVQRLAFPFIDEILSAARVFKSAMDAEAADGQYDPELAQRQGLMAIGFALATGLVALGFLLLIGDVVSDVAALIMDTRPPGFFGGLFGD